MGSYRRKAESLPRISHIYAVSLYTTLRECLPEETFQDHNHWDFVLSIACMNAALDCLVNNKDIEEKSKINIFNEVILESKELFPDAELALKNCRDIYYENLKNYIRNRILEDDWTKRMDMALGHWIFLNLTKRNPEGQTDIEASIILGHMVWEGFGQYWVE